jgi:hypothetical protein
MCCEAKIEDIVVQIGDGGSNSDPNQNIAILFAKAGDKVLHVQNTPHGSPPTADDVSVNYAAAIGQDGYIVQFDATVDWHGPFLVTLRRVTPCC